MIRRDEFSSGPQKPPIRAVSCTLKFVKFGGPGMQMRTYLVLMTMMLAGCAGQNLIQSQDARHQLVGFSEEKILACMGRPQGRFTFANTEVWQYNSGTGRGGQSSATGGTQAMGAGAPVKDTRYCVVNIAMSNKAVQSVSYTGLTGVLPEDEQCASAIKKCLPQ